MHLRPHQPCPQRLHAVNGIKVVRVVPVVSLGFDLSRGQQAARGWQARNWPRSCRPLAPGPASLDSSRRGLPSGAQQFADGTGPGGEFPGTQHIPSPAPGALGSHQSRPADHSQSRDSGTWAGLVRPRRPVPATLCPQRPPQGPRAGADGAAGLQAPRAPRPHNPGGPRAPRDTPAARASACSPAPAAGTPGFTDLPEPVSSPPKNGGSPPGLYWSAWPGRW